MTEKNIFKGRWIVRYDPESVTYTGVLDRLLKIRETHRETMPEESVVFIRLGSKEPEIIIKNDIDSPADLKMSPRVIERVGLCFPVSSGDRRWNTIPFTTSGLYLGSALQQSGFSVYLDKLDTVSMHEIPKDPDTDVLGVSLIEDMYPVVKESLQCLSGRNRKDLLVAAGGPMVTLHPMASVYHFPEVNLFVRGEGEVAFPEVLTALKEGCMETLLKLDGICFQEPGLVILSNWDRVNRPDQLSISFGQLDFLSPGQLRDGLEANFSRGCRYGCLFCSKVQGRQYRKLPVENVSDLLTSYKTELGNHGISHPSAMTVNINDDDILQDPEYAESVFSRIKGSGFRLWGIQSSLNSFFDSSWHIREDSVLLSGDHELFVNGKPLLWLGTDVFVPGRGKRLGKRLPPKEKLLQLLDTFEKKNILNYHYWISSDHRTDWREFVAEFDVICELMAQFEYFNLLAHSPFVVPYPSSPLYRSIIREDRDEQIRVKQWLRGPHPVFDLPLVERAVTGFSMLNQMLENSPIKENMGFFDYLKDKNIRDSWVTIYTFLKKERMAFRQDDPLTDSLLSLESLVEERISSL